MHVYLVRHAETMLNEKHIHQFPSTPLSEKGRDDAITTAEYLRGMNPDFLISSDYTRAVETARIIGMHTGLVPQTSTLFYEIMRPSSLYGRSHFCLETFAYVLLSVLRRKNPAWRYKDAENMHDLVVRSKEAFSYLEDLNKKYSSVIVVTHSVFMNFLVAHMCAPGPLGFFALLKAFLKIKFTKNGSVVHLEYLSKEKKRHACAWQKLDYECHSPLCE